MLEYAAVLHDIGWKEGRKGHHKSSLEMIMGEDRLPFDGRERAIVANVARYHRGALPEDGHRDYRDLEAADRKVVDRLASILRVADALDVSHASVVRSIECHDQERKSDRPPEERPGTRTGNWRRSGKRRTFSRRHSIGSSRLSGN